MNYIASVSIDNKFNCDFIFSLRSLTNWQQVFCRTNSSNLERIEHFQNNMNKYLGQFQYLDSFISALLVFANILRVENIIEHLWVK